jgi:hypothetical protein
MILYSLAALLIRIPPTHGKGLPVDESKDFWDGIKRNKWMSPRVEALMVEKWRITE